MHIHQLIHGALINRPFDVIAMFVLFTKNKLHTYKCIRTENKLIELLISYLKYKMDILNICNCDMNKGCWPFRVYMR